MVENLFLEVDISLEESLHKEITSKKESYKNRLTVNPLSTSLHLSAQWKLMAER